MIEQKTNDSGEIWVNEFTEESAKNFREEILKSAKSNPEIPIIIYLDSFGGHADSLAKMIATMNEIPNIKITVAMGKAMSAGAVMLSHGDIRFCDKDSRIMVHEISAGTGGDVHDMMGDALEVKRLNRHFIGLLARNCGMKGGYNAFRKLIKSRDGRNIYLSAPEAVKFGIVDYIGTPTLSKVTIHNVAHTKNRPRHIVKKKKRVKKVKKTSSAKKTS